MQVVTILEHICDVSGVIEDLKYRWAVLLPTLDRREVRADVQLSPFHFYRLETGYLTDAE